MTYSKGQRKDERRKVSRRNKKVKDRIYKKTKGHCAYCGVHLRKEKRTIDHIVPIAEGGRTKEDNLVLSCERCNTLKGDMGLDRFREVLREEGVRRDTVLWFEQKGIKV